MFEINLEGLIDQLSNSNLSIWGPFLILILCGLGLPLPEDIVLVASGVLAAEQDRKVFPVVLLMYFGILLGDMFTFSVGRLLGGKAVKSRWGRWAIPPERLARAEVLFKQKGGWVIFVGRFLPGLRAPIFFSAGALQFSRLKFLLIDGLAALVSAPFFVWLGHWAWIKYAEDFDKLERAMGRTQLYFIVAVVVLALVAFSVYRSRSKKRQSS